MWYQNEKGKEKEKMEWSGVEAFHVKQEGTELVYQDSRTVLSNYSEIRPRELQDLYYRL